MCDIIGRAQSLSLLPKSSTVDFCAAVNVSLLDVICTDLREFRAQDQHLNKFWTDTLAKCDLCDIETGGDSDNLTVSRPTRRRKLPAHLADSCDRNCW